MKEFNESLNVSDNVQFLDFKRYGEKDIVWFSVNGEPQYKEFDKLSFFMKKFITKNLLKV